MSLVISENYSSADAGVIGRSFFAFTEDALRPNVRLRIALSDFNFELSAPIIDYTPTLESGEVTIRATVDESVVAFLTLTGALRKGTSIFETETFSFGIQTTKPEPRAVFIASSIMAMLGLLQKMEIQIAELEIGQTVTFDAPLLVTSGRLEQRLIAYRLMVIEQAVGKKLVIPDFISRQDLGSIAFVYHAIVDRKFSWPSTETFEGTIPATATGRLQASIDKPTVLTFDQVPLQRVLFGETISLGYATIIVADAVVVDPASVDRELRVDDGHEISFSIRSQSGCATYQFPHAPHFHARWDSRLKVLIDLETQIDASLVARYNQLAAATLADLSEEEKQEITARSELSFQNLSIDE